MANTYLQTLLGESYREGMTEDEIASAIEALKLTAPKSEQPRATLETDEVKRLKELLSKANSEAADYKKQLRTKQSEAEIKEAEEKERQQKLMEQNQELTKRLADLDAMADELKESFDPDLKELADKSLDGARSKLTDILANYRGYRGMDLILVFDAYKVAGGQERCFLDHGIHVVYTKEAETADAYIERTTHALSGKCDVTVATSDGTEQIIIWGKGARRMSARELMMEMNQLRESGIRRVIEKPAVRRSTIGERLPEDVRRKLDEMKKPRE